MSTKLKVNVVIAGRVYPLNVNSIEEEEGVRKAAKNINELVTKFEQNYAVDGKQDVLAMCALHFASTLKITLISKEREDKETSQQIKALIDLINAQL